MRVLYQFLCSVVFLVFLGVASQAQIILDPEDPDTPGGGEENMPPQCTNCCSFYPVDPVCQFYCGCSTPSICPSFMGLQSPAVGADNIAEIYGSIADTREKMTDSERGKTLLSAWETHAKRVVEIYKARPALAERVGKALVTYWPTDIWSGGGKTVEPEALQELRGIVQQIARADAKSDGGDLAGVIRKQVLPRLDENLIGRSHADAFQCFISDKGC